jgi:chromosomal replication initiator protein
MPSPLDEVWSRIDAFLRARLRPDLYARWFAPLRPVSVADGRIQIAAPDRFHRDFIEDHYRPFFEEFLPGAVGEPLKIAFVVDEGLRAPSIPPPAPTPGPMLALHAPRAGEPQDPRDTRPNPRYLFETFVVGDSNRFAFSA